MSVSLATVFHDPKGVFYKLLERNAEILFTVFDHVSVYPSPDAFPSTLTLLNEYGAIVEVRSETLSSQQLGRIRREAVKLALSTQ